MLLLLVCVSHSFTLVYLFLCCVHSPVASWHQVGGKRQDAVQSQDSCSINHICTGTAGLLFLFKYWGGYIYSRGAQMQHWGPQESLVCEKMLPQRNNGTEIEAFFFCLVGQKTRSAVNSKTGFGQRITWFNDTECVLLWCNVSSPGSVSTQILPALPVDDLRRQPCRTYQIPEGAFPSNLDI